VSSPVDGSEEEWLETASGVGAEAEMEIGKGIVLSYTKGKIGRTRSGIK
jgi:hypothetical protein